MRITKIAGLLLAMLALGGLIAAAAQAGEYEAEGEKYPTSATGKQIEGTVTGTVYTIHEFKTSAGNVKCKTANFTGTISAKTTAQKIVPSYSECTLSGVGATVSTTGCSYTFTAGETVGSADKVTNAVDVVCESGKSITVTSANCVVTVPGGKAAGESGAKNQNLTKVVAENNTTATPFMDIKAEIDVEGIHYGTNGKCPNDGGVAKTNTDGKYLGWATLQSSERGITVT